MGGVQKNWGLGSFFAVKKSLKKGKKKLRWVKKKIGRGVYFLGAGGQKNGGGEGGTNETPGTDHVTSMPMRGLKNAPDGTEPHTHGHHDSMTESAQWGRFSEN